MDGVGFSIQIDGPKVYTLWEIKTAFTLFSWGDQWYVIHWLNVFTEVGVKGKLSVWTITKFALDNIQIEVLLNLIDVIDYSFWLLPSLKPINDL